MNKNAIISLIVGLVIGGLAVGLFMYFGVGSTGTFLGKQITPTPTTTPAVTTTPVLSTSGVTSTVPLPADLAPLVDTPTQTWAVAYWVTKPSNVDAEPALVPVSANNDKSELVITWKKGWVTHNQLLDFKNMDEKSRYNFAAGIEEKPSGPVLPDGGTAVSVHITGGSLLCFTGSIYVK